MTKAIEKQDFFFLHSLKGDMGKYDASYDRLHTDLLTSEGFPSSVETHYFGFNVPGKNIDGFCYAIHRPNLGGVLGGGVQVFKGIKSDMTACELFDMRNYMSPKALAYDLTSFELECGYRCEMLEPGKRWRVRYDDPQRKNAFDLEITAASDVIVWPNGRHIEQTMRNRGHLTLRGEHYEVDSYHVRDRTWEARMERPERIPAITWAFGVLDENLSFQFSGFDHPDLNPEWKDHFTIKPEDTLKGGWIWKDGEAAFLVDARCRVTRNPKTLFPESLQLAIEDSKGRKLSVKGVITAAAPISPMMHQRGLLCQTRWETDDGRVLWGETQDVHYTDYVYAMMLRSP